MKKLLCIFTLLTLVSVSVYAEPKKDMKTDFTNFTEEQIQNVSNSVKDNSVMAQELKTLLNEELKDNMATLLNLPVFKQTRLKTFFDNDKYGVKKYGETSTALLDTYKERCGGNKAVTTDDINWEVEKSRSLTTIELHYDDRIYFNEYDFSVECPNGGVYIAHKLCFMTVKNNGKEGLREYVNCEAHRVNVDDTKATGHH